MRTTLPVRPGSATGVRAPADAPEEVATAFYLGYRLRISSREVRVYGRQGGSAGVVGSVRLARLFVRRLRRLERQAAA